MRSNICLILVCIFFCSPAFSQSRCEKDIGILHYIVNGFLEKSDKYYESRKSEYMLMLLETDTSGAVIAIHLLADRNNMDSTWSMAERMRPADFDGTRFTLWKDKIIRLPIYSLAGDIYDHSRKNYVAKSIVQYSMEITNSGEVMIGSLFYITPGKPNSVY